MNADVIDLLSQRLLSAERERSAIDPITILYPDLSEADAYAIARQTMLKRQQKVVGFKLGYTSAAMRLQMGIDTPNFGYLTRDQMIDPDEPLINFHELIHPLVEAEIAITIRRDIKDGSQNRFSISRYVESVHPAIEVVDTRYHEYKFSSVDNISDNSSSARLILGQRHLLESIDDLRLVGTQLWSEGAVIDQGIGANALGNPLRALAWLANTLIDHGQYLAEGSVVLTGGLTRAYPAKAGQGFIAEMYGLGTVRLHFARSAA